MTSSAASLRPDIGALVTEDDLPVDNFASEKQQRLLTEPLYSSWERPDGRPFLAAANVGVFPSVHTAPIVPDVLLSLDVSVPDDWWAKHQRTYFVWEFGKVPEVAIEVVSNLEGEELGRKLDQYAWMRVAYYVVWDPQRLLLREDEVPVRLYTNLAGRFVVAPDLRLPNVGLGLALWDGEYETKWATWLRWVDGEGQLVPTGRERAETERERAETERERADAERERAEEASARAQRLADRLRALGEDPDAE